jgi:hypothetical protein
MTDEIWNDINGFDGYQISSVGNVRSFWRRVNMEWVKVPSRPKPLRHSIAKKGYHMARLQDRSSGKQKLVSVHLLVLKSFVGPRPDKYHDGCHLDDDKDNNSIKNLAWNTKHKNLQDRFKNKGGEKLSKEQIGQIREMISNGNNQSLIASQFGVCQSHISRIKTRKYWHYV